MDKLIQQTKKSYDKYAQYYLQAGYTLACVYNLHTVITALCCVSFIAYNFVWSSFSFGFQDKFSKLHACKMQWSSSVYLASYIMGVLKQQYTEMCCFYGYAYSRRIVMKCQCQLLTKYMYVLTGSAVNMACFNVKEATLLNFGSFKFMSPMDLDTFEQVIILQLSVHILLFYQQFNIYY